MASTVDTLDRELAGLDALDLRRTSKASWAVRAWSATWPKLAAVALALLLWQALIWIEWKPLYAFPPPAQVFATLGELVDHIRVLVRGRHHDAPCPARVRSGPGARHR